MAKHLADQKFHQTITDEELKMSPEKRERLARNGVIANEDPAEPEYVNEATTDQDTQLEEDV